MKKKVQQPRQAQVLNFLKNKFCVFAKNDIDKLTMGKKTFWNNKWVVGIGSAILASIMLDSFNVTDIWVRIWGIFVFIWNFLLQRIETPLWILIILPFAGIGILLLILWMKSLNVADNDEPAFFDYREDTFDDKLYRWEYRLYGDKYIISNIIPHCTKCKCRLSGSYCPNCKISSQGFEMSDDEIQSLIIHRIENLESK